MMAEGLRERGVQPDLTIDPSAPSGTMLVVHEPGERSMVADRGANAQLVPGDLPATLEAGAVLVSGYLLLHESTHAAAVSALEHANARFVAVDAASWPLVEAFGVDRFFAATEKANVLFANEREAQTLTGLTGVEAADILSQRYLFACVKLGAAGAIVITQGEVHKVEAEQIVEVDPTGAGDAFDGVLLAALSRGADLDDALSRACHAGALVAASESSWPTEGSS
jgi:sugar/nucleoside kinase (ribokinase family)